MDSVGDVEDFVYRSYVRASRHWPYGAPDRERRHPELVSGLLGSHPAKPTAVITGSKGKGSLCCMLSAILSQKHRTGMLTSPHTLYFNQLFKINSTLINNKVRGNPL